MVYSCRKQFHRSPLLEQAATTMGLESGGMDTSISCHPATQQPWRDRFSPISLHHEEYMLIAACFIICAYLSGMRVSEIMQLQRGCHFTETTADGLITRHKLRGTTFKDHGRRGIPATWVVILFEYSDQVVTGVKLSLIVTLGNFCLKRACASP